MHTHLDAGCGPTDNLISPIFSKLCDPNKEVTSCPGVRFTPDILQQFHRVFYCSVVHNCLCICCMITPSVSRSSDLCPNQPENGLANILGSWSVFDFPWLICFPLSVFVVIKTAAANLRSAPALLCGTHKRRNDVQAVLPKSASWSFSPEEPRGGKCRPHK